ncbi:tRNA (guanine-N(7)-)-methyltransferase non-catalytic subunit WDR4 [Cryptosporidium felis]|nr:tRNA (guanine-N(7)-)-methyltransferase non-catalytic subunit WDR4 [Cryptosporidium felis]
MWENLCFPSLKYFKNKLIWFHGCRVYLFSIYENNRTEVKLFDESLESSIISMNISPVGIATICCNNKVVYLLRIEDCNLVLIGSYVHSKRAHISIYRPNNDDVLLCDKFGDLYLLNSSCFILNPSHEMGLSLMESDFEDEAREIKLANELNPITGHLSIVTCSMTSLNSKYIFTGNKCGKIWVSDFSNIENTISILCGHKDTISSLCEIVIPSRTYSFLITSSFDKSIKIWDYLKCEEIDSINMEGLKEIYCYSIIFDEKDGKIQLHRKNSTVLLDSVPHSIEVQDEIGNLTPFSDEIKLKSNQGCLVWYRKMDDINLVHSINISGKNISTNSIDEYDNIEYFATANLITSFSQTNKVLFQSKDAQECHPQKRIKFQDSI